MKNEIDIVYVSGGAMKKIIDQHVFVYLISYYVGYFLYKICYKQDLPYSAWRILNLRTRIRNFVL